ncbi:MAG: type II toxin-antitoxin system MqsA family antitoxin [Porticoccaceae bacterium]
MQQRRKLPIDQHVRGGINTFSRYENGKTKPPLALVKLLKVPDRHPDLLNEIRTG